MRREARGILVTAFAEQGDLLFGNGSVCVGILKDYGGNDHPEIRLLGDVVDQDIPRRLLQHGYITRAIVDALTTELSERRFYDRGICRWAVESWATALQLHLEDPAPEADDPPSAASAPQPEGTLWYYTANDQVIGPMPEELVGQFLDSGTLDANVLVWTDGMANWEPAGVNAILRNYLPIVPIIQKSSNPISTPATAALIVAVPSASFLYIPTERFVGMNVATLGIYQLLDV